MGIQMVFYLMFPVFLVFCRTKKSTWITFSVSIILSWSYLNFYSNGAASPHINIVRQFHFFVAGALLFHYSHSIESALQHTKVIVVVMCVFIDVVAFLLFPRFNEDVVMLVAFFAWMVLQIVNFDILSRSHLLCWLGKISYEIYLMHCVVYRFISPFFSNAIYSLSFPWSFLLHFCIVAVLTVASAMSYRFLYAAISRSWIKSKHKVA